MQIQKKNDDLRAMRITSLTLLQLMGLIAMAGFILTIVLSHFIV
jgi:hypothetical protein